MIEERVVKGIPWTLATFAVGKGLAAITVVILARFLSPNSFGLFALATLIVGAAGLFNDFGVGGALIVRHSLDERTLRAALAIMLLAGSSLALALILLAPVAGMVFDTRGLTDILRVLPISLALASPGRFYEYVLQRRLAFRRRLIALTGQAVVFAGVSIIAAAGVGAGVWSLVAGQLAGVTTMSVLMMSLAPAVVVPSLDRGSVRDLLHAGRGFFSQRLLAFTELNVDYLAIGKLLGSIQLGYYSLAYRIAELPYSGITEPVAAATFPGFASMRHRGENLTPAFLAGLQLVALVACPLGAWLSAFARPFVHALLGSKWAPAISTLEVLGIWAAAGQIEGTLGWFYNSAGAAGVNAAISALTLPALAAGVVLAADLGSISSVGWVILAYALVVLVIRAIVADRRLGVAVRRQWSSVRSVVMACGLSWVACRLTADGLESSSTAVVALFVSAVAGFVVYVGALALIEPAVLSRAVRQLKIMVRRSPRLEPLPPSV
jgi:PST family polysaccharide transporter